MCGKTGQITADARISAAILLCLRKVTTRCCISCKSCYTGYRRRKMCEKNVHLPWAEVPREEHEHAFCSKSRQNVAENNYFTTILLQYLQYAVIIN